VTAERPLRIAFATARYAPFIGGVEAHVRTVSRLLTDAGHSVTVLTTDPSGTLAPWEVDDGVEIVRVRAWPRRADLYVAPGVARVLAERRWDVVHVQSYHTFVAPIAMHAARRLGIPYVITLHGGGHSSRLRHRARSLQISALGPLLRSAHRLVATASFEIPLYGRLARIPRESFVLIPNGGADLLRPPGPRVSDGSTIVSMGRLERYKGHDRAIAALPAVIERVPAARLWIAGEGPDEARLLRLARRHGVEDRVEIRGVPLARRAEYVASLSRAALAVLLSEFETHPLSVVEAASLGCPVLVADTGGSRELAERGWARAVPLHETPQRTGEAMADLIESPPPPVAVELPTWDECCARLLEVYRDAVASARQG
jgi:glycosyltransferase involved in cell wall biosynthesis